MCTVLYYVMVQERPGLVCTETVGGDEALLATCSYQMTNTKRGVLLSCQDVLETSIKVKRHLRQQLRLGSYIARSIHLY